MKFVKQFFGKDNSPEKPIPPHENPDFDKIAAAVRKETCIYFGMDPG